MIMAMTGFYTAVSMALTLTMAPEPGNSASYPNPHGVDPLLVAHLERNGWKMVLRATAGNGKSAFNAWTQGTDTTKTKPVDMARTNSLHFRQENIEQLWASLDIKHVKLALYKDNTETAYIIFDGVGSNITSWFNKTNVLESSWIDLTNTATYNWFSASGPPCCGVARRFFINQIYGGCGGDIGHFAVIEHVGTQCAMDKQVTLPQFVYSDTTTVDVWERRQYKRADHMAFYVHIVPSHDASVNI